MSGIKNIIFHNLRRCFVYLFISFLFVTLTSCGIRNANIDPGSPVQLAQFTTKRVAILPVHGDDSIGTDSQLQLKRAINLKLDKKIKSLLRNSTIVGFSESVRILNRNSLLTTLNELYVPYRSVGVFDEKLIRDLFNTLNCDYLVISELKHETVDFIAANVYLLSLDVLIVNRRNEIVWTGTGDFKQGGMFGAGRVSTQQGAQEIVELAFAYWKSVYTSPGHGTSSRVPATGRQTGRRHIDPMVQNVQKILIEKHYNPGPADGLMGRRTRQALKEFQRDNALAVTGTIDDETYNKLTDKDLSLSGNHPVQEPPGNSTAEGEQENENLNVIIPGLNLPVQELPDNDPVEREQEEPLKQPEAVSEQEPSGKYITTDSADLLEEEDLYGANIILTIPRNTVLNVLSKDGEYYKVRYREKEGYIHFADVSEN